MINGFVVFSNSDEQNPMISVGFRHSHTIINSLFIRYDMISSSKLRIFFDDIMDHNATQFTLVDTQVLGIYLRYNGGFNQYTGGIDGLELITNVSSYNSLANPNPHDNMRIVWNELIRLGFNKRVECVQ
jgi:hypothetical protein